MTLEIGPPKLRNVRESQLMLIIIAKSNNNEICAPNILTVII